MSDQIRTALTDLGQRFTDAMNEDFNTAAAIAVAFDFANFLGFRQSDATEFGGAAGGGGTIGGGAGEFISKYVFSRDHKIIGLQFLFSTLLWFLIGGLLITQRLTLL